MSGKRKFNSAFCAKKKSPNHVLVHFSNRSVKTAVVLVVPYGTDVSFECLSPIRQLSVETQRQILSMCRHSAVSFMLVHFSNRSVKTGAVLAVSRSVNLSDKLCPVACRRVKVVCKF